VPGSRVAVNLSGVDLTDVRRGDTLTIPGWLAPTLLVDTRLRLWPTRRVRSSTIAKSKSFTARGGDGSGAAAGRRSDSSRAPKVGCSFAWPSRSPWSRATGSSSGCHRRRSRWAVAWSWTRTRHTDIAASSRRSSRTWKPWHVGRRPKSCCRALMLPGRRRSLPCSRLQAWLPTPPRRCWARWLPRAMCSCWVGRRAICNQPIHRLPQRLVGAVWQNRS